VVHFRGPPGGGEGENLRSNSRRSDSKRVVNAARLDDHGGASAGRDQRQSLVARKCELTKTARFIVMFDELSMARPHFHGRIVGSAPSELQTSHGHCWTSQQWHPALGENHRTRALCQSLISGPAISRFASRKGGAFAERKPIIVRLPIQPTQFFVMAK
jgi:hypothetical protein